MARRRERPRPRGGGGRCCPPRLPEPGPRGLSAPALGPRLAGCGLPGGAGRLPAPRGSGGRNRPAAEAERGAVMELGAVMAGCGRVCPGHRHDPRPPLPAVGRTLSPRGLFLFLSGVWQRLLPKRGEPVPPFGAGGGFALPPRGVAAGPLTL